MDLKTLDSYCVYDVETTGLDPVQNRVIEHGCIRVRDNKVVDKCVCLVNQPSVKWIAPEALAAHGITVEKMRANGMDAKIACEKTLAFLGDDIVMGLNNIPFDYPFLECEANRLELSRPKIQNWLDVGLLHKGLHMGNTWNGKEEFYRYALRIHGIRAKGVKYNLNHLTKVYEIENLRGDENGLHGAEIDVVMCHHLFQKMKAKYFNK